MDDLPKFPNHWHLPGDLQRKPASKNFRGFQVVKLPDDSASPSNGTYNTWLPTRCSPKLAGPSNKWNGTYLQNTHKTKFICNQKQAESWECRQRNPWTNYRMFLSSMPLRAYFEKADVCPLALQQVTLLCFILLKGTPHMFCIIDIPRFLHLGLLGARNVC